MTNKPLISVSIPTFNSGQTLRECLVAVRNQKFPSLEIIVIDGGSSDSTLEICSKLHVDHCYNYSGGLLGARELGVKKSKGKYSLLLDSDQILQKGALRRLVKYAESESLDMVILEEQVFQSKNWLEKLFAADRSIINAEKDLDPVTGVLLPRFFRRSLLLKALNSIPTDLKKTLGGQDHAILYFEAWQLSQRVGYLTQAVLHKEPVSFLQLWRKFYRWGKTSSSARSGKYAVFLAQKEHFRSGLFKRHHFRESIQSILLLILKGIPFSLGRLFGERNI